MLFQLRDLIIPSIAILVIAGFQISAYFMYQYFKFKKEKLHLNRILLSYSSFFGLGFTGILFRNINRFFIEDYLLKTIFLKITNFIFILAICLFLFFITSKSFNEIVNSTLTRIICCINTLPLICIILFQPDSPVLYLILMITLIGILFMFFFQLKLIIISTRNIRIRLILIFIGQIFLGGAMFMGGELFRNLFLRELEELFLIIIISISIIALMIIFLGVFNFPPFLEFEWKKYLEKIFIVDQQNFKIIYEFDFTSIPDKINHSADINSNLKKDKVFFSRGIFGINDIISSITNLNEGGIKKIRQGDVIILLNQGDDPISFIIYGLLVNKELISYEYFLKTIKNQFQEIYRNILLNIDAKIGNVENIIKGFDKIIKKIME